MGVTRDGEPIRPSLAEQLSQIEAAIAAQEALRATFGDAIVEAAVVALRKQRDALHDQLEPIARPRADLSPAQLLERLKGYLPRELADKMRATGQIEGERRQVTVVFADLSGYTALSERLDPEEVMDLTNGVLKELSEAVYQFEGYVDRLLGDSVVALFGAPVAHEDDPERALHAALAMRDRLAAQNDHWIDRLGEPLSLHIGVNTGLVVAGNVGSNLRMAYTVIGDTANTTARLESAAKPGEILVSQDTYLLTHEAFSFQELEPIVAKGKREPVAVYALERARLHPGKSRGLVNAKSILVGRDHELSRLRGVRDALGSGRGRVVTITGEAGIGKSRLLSEWHAELGDGVRWLEGRSFAYTTGLAYGPFLDLIRRYADIRDDDSEADALSRLQAVVSRHFPDDPHSQAIFAHLLGMRLSPAQADLLAGLSDRVLGKRLFELIEEVFVQLARERPTVLAMEDMHWADRASLELVEHLLSLTGDLPLAVICVFRLHRHRDVDEWLTGTARYADQLVEIALAPLSPDSSLEMAGNILSTEELPGQLRTLVVQKAEGNPFFVEEVIRTLIARGALVRQAASNYWVFTRLMDQMTVPDTLQGLLMARLDILPAQTKWLAQQASVIGRIFLYRVLQSLADESSSLDANLSELEREELIRQWASDPELEYIFSHALTQEVAYQSLLAPRRQALHRRVGEVIEAIFADRLGEFSGVLAGHFLRGEAWEKACDYLVKAGNAAARLHAYTEARLHYSGALDALSHQEGTEANRRLRVDTIAKLVGVSIWADAPELNLERLTEAESLVLSLGDVASMPGGDRLRLARVRFLMGRVWMYRNEMREAVKYFREVLTTAQEFGNDELLAIPSATIGRVMVLQGQFGKAGVLLSQAVESLEKTAEWQDHAYGEWGLTVGFLGCSLAARGHIAAGLAEGQRALEHALEISNLSDVAAAHSCLSFIFYWGGDLQRMLGESLAALEAAEKSKDRLFTFVGLALRGWAESLLGERLLALDSFAASSEIGKSLGGQLVLDDWFAAAHAQALFSAGCVDEALTLSEIIIRAARKAGSLFAEGLARRVRAAALASLPTSRWEDVEVQLVASQSAFESGDAQVELGRTHLAWAALSRDFGHSDVALDRLDKASARFAGARLSAEQELLSRALGRLAVT